MTKRGLCLSAAVLFYFMFAGNLFGDGSTGEDQLRDWFSESVKSGRYESIEDDLRSLFRRADNSGAPPGVLMEKLREGAAKGIPPGRLMPALRNELKSLITAGEDYRKLRISNKRAETVPDIQNAYKIIAIMLREEIEKETIRELLQEAGQLDLPLSAGTAACSAVFQASSVTGLRDGDLLRLGISLYNSTLGPSNYGAVASIFVKGRVNRLSEEEILDIIEDVFARGGGLIRLERELNKRTRR